MPALVVHTPLSTSRRGRSFSKVWVTTWGCILLLGGLHGEGGVGSAASDAWALLWLGAGWGQPARGHREPPCRSSAGMKNVKASPFPSWDGAALSTLPVASKPAEAGARTNPDSSPPHPQHKHYTCMTHTRPNPRAWYCQKWYCHRVRHPGTSMQAHSAEAHGCISYTTPACVPRVYVPREIPAGYIPGPGGRGWGR